MSGAKFERRISSRPFFFILSRTLLLVLLLCCINLSSVGTCEVFVRTFYWDVILVVVHACISYVYVYNVVLRMYVPFHSP